MDAAARYDGVSLNDKIHTGSDLLNSLVGMWWNLDLERPPDVYQMLLMIFGASSSQSMVNYVLRKTALDNRQDAAFSGDTIKSVEKNF